MEHKVLVVGATGNTGIEICKELKHQSIDFSAFGREESKEKLKDVECNYIGGNILDENSISEALKTKEYTDVIIALGARNLKQTMIRSEGTKNVTSALNSLNKKSKLHVVSAHGVGDSWDTLNWMDKMICKLLIKTTMKDHNEQEDYVKQNTGGYHIIRPGELKNTPKSESVQPVEKGPLTKRRISRADLAFYLVKSMKEGVDGIHSVSEK